MFDVFGTVVDWRGSVTREGRKLGEAKGISHVDWAEFTDAWRAGYGPSMARVRNGELPWTKSDVLHRMVLDELLDRFVVTGLSEEEKRDFNFAWHRLDPWPDSVPGLTRMKQRYTIATLSNGNVDLLINMAKWAGLPWDSILSAEIFKHYKPDPETYLGAAEILGLEPSEVMMVAAHKGDLNSAREAGLKTAFVPRPGEHGPNHPVDTLPEDWIDVAGFSFEDLATRLDV
ncbi:haloacid dehalogenase type II [Dehalococcoidia bacterium]|nr:haloacid dehalogenase type II [Dehalococcoidia bacterium]